MTNRTCSLDGCDKTHLARGLCNKHLRAADRARYEADAAYRATVIARFWTYVARGRGDECWLWTGGRDAYGYGSFNRSGTTVGAYRFAYELEVGEVPTGLVLDHLCRVRLCCNPAHLEPIERGQNVLRGIGFAAVNAAKTHCVHGHSLADAYRAPNGWRTCRTCHNERRRRAA